MFISAGAGEEVPADRSLPQHEGDPDQEERADQRTEEAAAEVASRSSLPLGCCSFLTGKYVCVSDMSRMNE